MTQNYAPDYKEFTNYNKYEHSLLKNIVFFYNKENFDRILIRTCDLIFSVAGILFLLPVFITIALLVYLQDKGPIFYGQSRIGKGGKKFKCYKFRSMIKNSAEVLDSYLKNNPEARIEWENDHKLKNDPRITSLGKFLRKTSLDEFPQLWNVVKGEMSLIGPRPIVEDEIIKYKFSFRQYIALRPGISGLWQISGRNDVDYNRRVALDRLFYNKFSFEQYLFILFATIPAVLKQRGSY